MTVSQPIRVLVVDDSGVVRRVVQRALESDPDFVVVATAADGRAAVEKVRELDPDVVTLDIEMPVMDGLAALKAIRQTHPRLPVIMFSTLTQRGARTTLDALALGASDYVTKPSNMGGLDEAVKVLRLELLPMLKELAGIARRTPAPRTPSAPSAAPATTTITTSGPIGTARLETSTAPDRGPARGALAAGGVAVVAIGVSTGGPNALSEVIPALPGDLPVPVLIVQHMPALFTQILADRLNGRSALTVAEGAEGAVVEPGGVWIAPGGHHMVVRRDGPRVRIAITDDPPENSCRPSVDPLLRSVGRVYGRQALTVIMTGMGQDGLRGIEALRAAGASVLAQDEATSVVWGMPGIVTRNGLADEVLPLAQIAPEIVRLASGGRPGAGRPLRRSVP
jgi:two-component system chemotaxis response regulator CheB